MGKFLAFIGVAALFLMLGTSASAQISGDGVTNILPDWFQVEYGTINVENDGSINVDFKDYDYIEVVVDITVTNITPGDPNAGNVDYYLQRDYLFNRYGLQYVDGHSPTPEDIQEWNNGAYTLQGSFYSEAESEESIIGSINVRLSPNSAFSLYSEYYKTFGIGLD